MNRRAVAAALLLLAACATGPPPRASVPSPEELRRHCREVVGEPRILQPAPGIWVAVGYDLANTILIATAAGNVLVDPGMAPSRARRVREELLRRAPGPITAIVYTHSHIDHVGAAGVWAQPWTQIWATRAFRTHFLKQYGAFLRAERRRGRRQFGVDLPEADLPCSALGRRIDLVETLRAAAPRLPTHTFRGHRELEIGGRRLVLLETPGETHDQLAVWLPEARVLLVGDNFYWSFPNLYTIRGTSPRPVTAWIASLDRLRRLDPAVLIPSHTPPVTGAARIRRILRDYRDAIAWIYAETVRAANAGIPIEALAARLRLPAHLDRPYLRELYGQISWSVRAIYDAALGWFDEAPEALYPLPPTESARRYVVAMGGPEAVLARQAAAIARGQVRWAVELGGLLRRAGAATAPWRARWRRQTAAALRALAATIANSNGRAYLLTSAQELEGELPELPQPRIDPELLAALPVRLLLEQMLVRLRPEATHDVHEALVLHFTDTGERYVLTVRRGVAELVAWPPLPGTPEPLATLTTTTSVWRRLALRMRDPVKALVAGELQIDGSLLDVRRFFAYFDQDL